MFVGEIGLPRHEYLYVIQFWEAQRILDGYQNRKRDLWSAVRWQTYHIMAAQVGGKELSSHGIHKATDLLPLPWDTDKSSQMPLPTEDDVKQMQAEMAAWNANLKKVK